MCIYNYICDKSLIMIDRIRETVKTYLNTNNRGNFTPKKFDYILHNIVTQKYEELLFDVNRLVNRQNRGLINGGLENLTDKVREKVQYYLVPAKTLEYSAEVFVLPDDLRYFDIVTFNDEIIELCKSNREFRAISTTEPTEEYPIGLKQGNILNVLPETIEDNVKVSYLRNPKQAKWTYNIVDDVEMFNPDADDFQDVDVHPSEEDDIVIRVLQGFGIELKEQDIQKGTQDEKVREFNRENTN